LRRLRRFRGLRMLKRLRRLRALRGFRCPLLLALCPLPKSPKGETMIAMVA